MIHCHRKHRPARFCGLVILADIPRHHLFFRFKKTSLLQIMQDGIQRAGAESVPMSFQFTDHIQPKNGFDGGMVQDVQADKAKEEITSYIIVIVIR